MNVLMDSFPWLLRSHHELWLTALGLGSAFRGHGACDVKDKEGHTGRKSVET